MLWTGVGLVAGLIALIFLWIWLRRYEQQMVASAEQAVQKVAEAQQALQARWASPLPELEPPVRTKPARHRRHRRASANRNKRKRD